MKVAQLSIKIGLIVELLSCDHSVLPEYNSHVISLVTFLCPDHHSHTFQLVFCSTKHFDRKCTFNDVIIFFSETHYYKFSLLYIIEKIQPKSGGML